MKFHLVILSIVCLTIGSCKKKEDRTCTCAINTSGNRTTHSQSAGVSFTLNLGIPIPIPPVEITPAKDTTVVTPFTYSDTQKTIYQQLTESEIEKVCPTSQEETYSNGYTTVVPGSSTVTVSESGTKKSTCQIE
ncbi:hypothetical protein [Aurantibacillus circumpalustris]|uniref:hypothetical protein n=1 Tax=Aurantibacillus circumpalustris TaxID=3036359 RepID=UPI00295AB72E|nr:hypothetical protein [Aurantibacillus circumpalustris]